jgi:hypothetical protein
MINNIVNSFRRHFSFLFAFQASKSHYIISLLLDPRFKSLDILKELYLSAGQSEMEAEENVMALAEACMTGPLLEYLTAAYAKVFPARQNVEAHPLVGRSFRYKKTAPSPEPTAWSPADAATAEFDKFTGTDFNMSAKASPLGFWSMHEASFPVVALLAEVFCGLNKTEVKVESLFSVCGILTLDRRNRLGEDLRNAYCQIWSALPRAKPTRKKPAIDKAVLFAQEENKLLEEESVEAQSVQQLLDAADPLANPDDDRFLDLLECLKILSIQPLDEEALALGL